VIFTRRKFLKLSAAGFFASASSVALGLGISRYRMSETTYKLTPPGWTPGLKLRVVVLADPHVSEPIMPMRRFEAVIEQANALKPDVMLIPGDLLVHHPFVSRKYAASDVAKAAAQLKSRYGTFAVCGNHDWWSDHAMQKLRSGPCEMEIQLAAQGIEVLENRAMPFVHDGKPFWILGTSSTIAVYKRPRPHLSFMDVQKALSQVTDDAPILHMAHEPDGLLQTPKRVSLTISGHTHGGQIRAFGYSPVSNSRMGNKFAYGHVIHNGQHMIVSGGVGSSGLPIRLGVPPEIVILELG
jgi:uncharacterized protein